MNRPAHFDEFDAIVTTAYLAMMVVPTLDLWTILIDKGTGRSFTPSQVDDAVDVWVLKSRRAGRSHALAELSARRACANALVAARAWEEVRNRGHEVAGWQWTKYGIAALRSLSGGAGIDLPDWAVER